MGNRAVITTAPFSEDNTGIYVHWNGGRESVEGFLLAARELGYRDPTCDPIYGLARLAMAIGLFFRADNDCSVGVGVGLCGNLNCDNGDNGTWLLGPGWQIVDREYGTYRPANEGEMARARRIADRIKAIVEGAVAATKAHDEASDQ